MNTCFECGKSANILSLIFHNTWFCSKKCHDEYLYWQLPKITKLHYYMLVEERKEMLRLAKQFEGQPCTCERASNGEIMHCEKCYATWFTQ